MKTFSSKSPQMQPLLKVGVGIQIIQSAALWDEGEGSYRMRRRQPLR